MLMEHVSERTDQQSIDHRRPRIEKARVSVIVPVKNEAENLRRCLPALAWADEVFVVDSQSTDETARVAAEHGARSSSSTSTGPIPRRRTGRSRTCRSATSGS